MFLIRCKMPGHSIYCLSHLNTTGFICASTHWCQSKLQDHPVVNPLQVSLDFWSLRYHHALRLAVMLETFSKLRRRSCGTSSRKETCTSTLVTCCALMKKIFSTSTIESETLSGELILWFQPPTLK